MFKPIFLTSSQQVLSLLIKNRLLPYNQTLIFYLDKNKCLIHQKNCTRFLSRRQNNPTSKDIFEPALKSSAKFIVICQIKASGNVVPSENDQSLSKSICHICKYLGVELSDYLIVSARNYYSWRETNLLDQIQTAGHSLLPMCS